MSLPLAFRPDAILDLQDARAWYESRRVGLGKVFALRAASSLDAIEGFPKLYGVVWKNIRAALIRRHHYIIYYRVRKDRVEIVAVLYARRDRAALKKRLAP